jgi:hypothetical protein
MSQKRFKFIGQWSKSRVDKLYFTTCWSYGIGQIVQALITFLKNGLGMSKVTRRGHVNRSVCMDVTAVRGICSHAL